MSCDHFLIELTHLYGEKDVDQIITNNESENKQVVI